MNKTTAEKHFVYKWTHTDGFYYIGKHSGTEDDGYTGSGILFKKFRELLNDGWEREILTKHATSDQALQSEKRIVGDKWKTDVRCLNCIPGGKINQKAIVVYYKEKLIRFALANLKVEHQAKETDSFYTKVLKSPEIKQHEK